MKEFEEKRQQCAKKMKIGIGLFISGFILVFLLFIAETNLEFLGAILVVPGFIVIIMASITYSSLSKTFKNKILQDLIHNVLPGSTYSPKNGISASEVYSFGLVKKADVYSTEDLIEGSYKGVDFKTADLKLEEKHVRHTKNGTQVYYVTYFQGRFFEFDFNKDFIGKILITEGSVPSTWGLEKIELESMEYNKKFKTYTSDEHTGFYVITPHFMEALMDVERQNPGTLSFCITGTKVGISLNNNRNTFEFNLFKPVDENTLKSVEKDFKVIINIIDELQLNKNIFKEVK